VKTTKTRMIFFICRPKATELGPLEYLKVYATTLVSLLVISMLVKLKIFIADWRYR